MYECAPRGPATIFALVVALVASFSQPANAQCVLNGVGSVPNGVTVGTQPIGDNANCTIDVGGSVATGGAVEPGIIGNNNNTVTNNGSISTTGNVSAGIGAFDNNTITNTGSISTTGDVSFGIDAFDNNTITNTGSISTSGDLGFGISVGDNNSITNTGSISTTGDVSFGIDALDNNTITNTGSISTSGDVGFGISVGDNNSITNTGSILTTGELSFGIDAFNNNTITNNGSISTTDDFSDGINAVDDNTITNNGRIRTRGDDAFGIFVEDNNVITNNGTIQTSGNTSNGIDGDDNNTIINNGTVRTTGAVSDGLNANDNSTIINTGTVSVSGVLSDAVDVDNNSTVINSGLLRSARDNALEFDGTGNELILLPGSIIIGGLEVDSPKNTLTVNPGLSLIYTFNGFMPGTINTFGAPFVVDGLRVAVLDPTILSQRDEMLADLTSGIFNSIHARLNGASGASSNALAGMQLGAGSMMQLGGGSRMNLSTADVTPEAADGRTGFWAHAFGGIRDEDASGSTSGSEHELAGGIAGIDGMVWPSVRLGAFGGASHANIETSFETHELDSDSYFGGVYVSTQQAGWFVHAMITAGQSNFDSSREVLNNLVSTGIQSAQASYDGTFVSPELTIGTALPMGGGFTIEPSLRGRYAYLSIDGYSESGAVDGLRVGDQDLSLWQGRAQVAFAYESDAGRFAPRVGIEGWTSSSDTISAVLIGQAISFNPGGDDDELTGFVGGTFTSNFGGGTSLFLDGDVHAGDDGFARAEARAGFLMHF